jgi:tyrosine-protein phosphatase SIW14
MASKHSIAMGLVLFHLVESLKNWHYPGPAGTRQSRGRCALNRRGIRMKSWPAWIGGALLALLIAVPPIIYHRYLYDHHKRLREVTAGKFYRSGQMTADGLRDAIHRFGIRTVINLQSENPDPQMDQSPWNSTKVSEVSLCRELGVRNVFLQADQLRSDRNNPEAVPDIVADYLKVLDDPSCYPVLLHCRAGLHRTGVLTAVYRMEYEDWSHALAIAELKGNGFDTSIGRHNCTACNDYVKQYVLNYRKRAMGAGNRESGIGKTTISGITNSDSRHSIPDSRSTVETR